jgi:hypothetical protein
MQMLHLDNGSLIDSLCERMLKKKPYNRMFSTKLFTMFATYKLHYVPQNEINSKIKVYRRSYAYGEWWYSYIVHLAT